MRYLAATPSLGLKYLTAPGDPQDHLQLSGYADADYAADLEERRSRSGYLWIIDGAPIAWHSAIQKTCVAQSTAEAEFVALAECCKEFLWLRQLLDDMGSPQKDDIPIYEDNRACIAFTQSGRNYRKLKHVDVRLHFLRDMIIKHHIKIHPIATNDQLADIFTKGLTGPKFDTLRQNLMTN